MIEPRPKDTRKQLDWIEGGGTYEWHVTENRLDWSPGLVKLYGLSRAPTAEEGFIRLVHPEDRMRVEAETSSFLGHGDSYQHEFRIVCPDGEVRHVHDRGVVVRAADGSPLVLRGLNFDVTAQRRDLATRQATRLDSAAGVGFYEHDPARRRSWWSRNAFGLFDMPVQEEVDTTRVTQERILEADRDRVAALLQRASRRLGPFEVEFRVKARDGSIRWLRDRGEAIAPIDPLNGMASRLRGTLTDVTDQRRHEPATQAGVETYRQVIERAPFGICVIDSGFRLIEVSAGAAPVFAGVAPLIGRDQAEVLRHVWPEPFATEVIERFRHTLATGETFHSANTRGRRRDIDGVQVYEWTLEQIVLPDGEPGVVCYFYDLSERTERETALRENEERLQLAYEASGMGAWDLDLTTGAAIWTPQLYDLLGLPRSAPTTGETFFDLVHPEDVEALRATFERSIETGEIFEAGYRMRRGDGAYRHFAGRGRIVGWQDGTPVRMIGVNFDVTERRRLEREIRENARQLRLILDNALAFIGVLDLHGTLLEANAPALQAGGLTRQDVIGKRFWDTWWWSHDEAVAARLRKAIATAGKGEAVRYDAVVRMQNDTRMTIDMLLSPILDDAGQVRQIVASGFDVTAREKAMEHVQLLMREINHRSKNTIALIQAVARQIWRADHEDFFPRFESRLQALASSHDLLVGNEWDGAALKDLARTQLAHFADLIGSRIHLDGPDIGVSSEAAKALGMAFHELATNAGKYGALSNDAGTVALCWSVAPDPEGEGRLTVSWTESGGPPVTPPEKNGFGSVVLDMIVGSTLSGDIRIDYPVDGLRWELTCSDRHLLA